MYSFQNVNPNHASCQKENESVFDECCCNMLQQSCSAIKQYPKEKIVNQTVQPSFFIKILK